jgi:hypothetical protein
MERERQLDSKNETNPSPMDLIMRSGLSLRDGAIKLRLIVCCELIWKHTIKISVF